MKDSTARTAPTWSPLRLCLALVFVVLVGVFAWQYYGCLGFSLILAAVFGAYMALNIGANDVANNVGPAVGARAIRLGTAVAIAAACEAAGAILAGGAVVGTVGRGIIDPAMIADTQVFIWIMTAALLAGALWLNIATAIGAPVSTTHSIVGGVLGAGIAARGWGLANWPMVGNIAMSWVLSPVLGGLFAAGFLFLIKHRITYKQDMVASARRTVPRLIGMMVLVFVAYLLLKTPGASRFFSLGSAAAAGAVLGLLAFLLARWRLTSRAGRIANSKQDINRLFAPPLVFAAALLSFAHGSNDVANAIGPLAAIFNVLSTNSIDSGAAVPFWTMLMGALGLSLGLLLYGPRLIKTVGSEITDMDNMRAYSIAMASAFTVILASQFGLPISTTHVTIGAVFGVGFLREHLKANYRRIIAKIERHHEKTGSHPHEAEAFLRDFEAASIEGKGQMLREMKRQQKLSDDAPLERKERKRLKKVYKEQLVRRASIMRVVAAWIITVPGTAVLAGLIYFTIRGMLLP